MKSRIIASLLMVSMLAVSGTVLAQDDHHGGPGGPGDHGDRGYHGGHMQHQSWHDASMDRPGGPMPHEDWHKGERVPAEYRDRNYVVDDWHEHGLSAPPRGYHWVGVNGDYVLAAVATGVIASVIANAVH
jgi:Ni/Co efflux regulator RcnB